MEFCYYQIDYNQWQFMLIFIDSIVTEIQFYVHILEANIIRFYTDFIQIMYTFYTGYIHYKIYFFLVEFFIRKNSKLRLKKIFVTRLALLKITKIDQNNIKLSK